MFIKAGSFKKLINAAAKSMDGLHIKNDGEGLWLTAPRWSMWIRKGAIPKQQLGDLIALIGWLPESGEAICVNKGSGQQIEMYDTIAESAKDKFEKCNTNYFVTRSLIQEYGWLRVLQSDNELLKAFCIDEDLYGVINLGEVLADEGEELPAGPKIATGTASGNCYENGACFMNNHMAFSIKIHVMGFMEPELSYMSGTRLVRTDEFEAYKG